MLARRVPKAVGHQSGVTFGNRFSICPLASVIEDADRVLLFTDVLEHSVEG